MAGNSVYKVIFHIQNAAGKRVSGPWSANIGISGGSRSDLHTSAAAASIGTAITNNLLGILQAQGYAGSAAPSGTIEVESYIHAQSPDVWT